MARFITRPAHLSRVATLEEYFEWLCWLIDVNGRGNSYYLLMNIMHNKTFKWSVPNDDNRACEGKNLREQFCEEENIVYDYDYFKEETSMLELLVALAFRCEGIMVDQREDIQMVGWFWEMLSNVGLDRYTDDRIKDGRDEDEIHKILDKIINRTYDRHGRGGLFPVKFNKKDQRNIELWYQMSEYLVENYYTEDVNV